MPSFTSKIPSLQQVGPICQVRIGLSSVASAVLKVQGQNIAAPTEVTALIDTGAMGTVVKPDVVKTLGLVSRGVVNIATPSTKSHPCNVYDISLHFPNGVEVSTLPAIEAPLEGQNIQCLIGRDVLAHGIFIYNGYTETFSLSF